MFAPPAREADVLRSARRALGEDRFAAAWADGAALTLEQTIAEALEVPTGPS
jgi:hypothetical protein